MSTYESAVRAMVYLDDSGFGYWAKGERCYGVYYWHSKGHLNPIEKRWIQAKAIRRRERCNVDTLFSIHVNCDRL
jgi:hypothetical protein